MGNMLKDIEGAVNGLKKLLPHGFAPDIGIICGSGLSGLHTAVTGSRTDVPYSRIAGFPVSTGK
jgi:purine nucleoside phosphorylase